MEYKSILLAETDLKIDEESIKILNKCFSEGWEYVDSIRQPVTSSSTYFGAIIVILKHGN